MKSDELKVRDLGSTKRSSEALLNEAIALPLPELDEAELTAETWSSDSSRFSNAPTTGPTILPGRPPAQTPGPEPSNASELARAYHAYPPPYSVNEVDPRLRRTYPYSAIGKLIIKFADDDRPGFASAAVIGEQLILTAAHCLDESTYGEIEWAVFISAYDDGRTSNEIGRWSVKQCALHPVWLSERQRGYDVAICFLRKDRKSRLAGRTCGYLGMVFDNPVEQLWHACGYPSELAPEPLDKPRAYDGGDLYENRSGFAYFAPRRGKAAVPPIGMGSNMTRGCSGGPWILDLDTVSSRADNNLINGVNSFRRKGFAQELFSPYFGRELLNFFSAFAGSVDTSR